jgi:hypothetical protein
MVKKSIIPVLYTSLTNDYFQYKGGTLGTLLPYGCYYLKMTTANGFIYYSEWFVVTDIYSNLITSFVNGTNPNDYEDFHTTGTTITLIESTAGTDYAYSNSFSVKNNEDITIIFFHTNIANQFPTFSLIVDSSVIDSETIVAGLNIITLTSTFAGTGLLRFSNTAAAKWSTSEIIAIRQYSADHIKLTFKNTNDLGDILYQDGFFQTLWLHSQLAPPQHEQIDIGEEKNGIFIAEKIVTKFKFRILAYIGRELYRALIRLPQHDDIDIIDEVGNIYSPAVGNIQVNPVNWLNFDYGQTEILFNNNEEIVWLSNNSNLT